MQHTGLVLKHYYKLKPIECNVVSGETDKLFTVKLNEIDSKGFEMSKGDPILIGTLETTDKVKVTGGSVIGVTLKENKYIICSNDAVHISKEMERRLYERYPTSLLGEIKSLSANKRDKGFIKDFSYSGLCFCSIGEYELNDTVEVSVYLKDNVSVYDGIIVRKSKKYEKNEYGVQIVYRDKMSMYALRNRLSTMVQNDRDSMYKQLIGFNYRGQFSSGLLK